MERNEEKSNKAKNIMSVIVAFIIAIVIVAALVVAFGFMLWIGGTTKVASVHNIFVLLTINDLPFGQYCLLSLYFVIIAFFIKAIFAVNYNKDKSK